MVPLDGSPEPDLLAARFHDFAAGLDLPRHRVEGLAVVAPVARVSTGWAAVLADRLGFPVLIENDSAAAALGEFWSRRVSRDQSFGSVYLSTGVGAGLVFGGALFRGASFDAGELGHLSIAYDGRPRPCGNTGCVERYASMAAHRRGSAGRPRPGRPVAPGRFRFQRVRRGGASRGQRRPRRLRTGRPGRLTVTGLPR